MKNISMVIFISLGLLQAISSYAMYSNAPTASDPVVTNAKSDAKLGIDELKNLSVQEIEAKIGHELTWKQKLAIKMTKNKLGKVENAGNEMTSDNSFFLGFLLGFLGLIGLLIVLKRYKGKKRTITGAWVGFFCGVILSFIILFSFLRFLGNFIKCIFRRGPCP